MTFDLVVENAEVLLPGSGPRSLSIGIRNGSIAALLNPGETVEAKDRLDASGLAAFPGVIDVHLHLGHGSDISHPREPEDAARETAAAASGGVTTMIPYLMGSEDYTSVFDGIIETTAKGARIDFGYHLIIATPEQLSRVPNYIRELGVPSFKIFMNNRLGEGARLGLPDIDDGFLYNLASQCAEHGGMVCPHPENIEIVHALKNALLAGDPDGKGGLAMWNRSRPPFVEADAVQRAGIVARAVGSRLYIVHTSSREALDAAERAREAGTDITIETCPHYLTHDVDWKGGDIGKINPPLREGTDREALWDGIRSGLVDTVATDHVHRHLSAKQGGIWKASPGCPGMDTLLPILLSEGHHKRGLALSRIAELLSENPAKAMGLWGKKGALLPGFDADLVLVDLDAVWTASNKTTHSSAGYTIYDGWDITGKVVRTLVRGQTVFGDGHVVDEAVGTGRYLKRSL